jgi:hypothetical protein
MSERGVSQDGAANGTTTRSPARACTLLMPVWGSSYVDRFLDYCLPTLLAPGNVPALAQALPTRFVLLTRSSDRCAIIMHPAWQRIGQLCDAAILPIDDLVGDGNHHACITLAYARALREAGAAITDTVFFFLVADYLVADGSLAAVLRRIRSGLSGVMAGSLQMISEAAVPLLHEKLHASAGELALPPRLLAGWALAHLHPSNAASLVNVSLLHDREASRLFWSVDERTLIARFYLLHMIAIHPEVTDFVVGAPCDYAFIPELCPSGRVGVISDSDDYLAVEMQTRERAVGQLRWGPLRASMLGRSLSRWTTALHRRNAGTTLVFHSGDTPQRIAEIEALASQFVAEVASSLSSQPQPHRGHPFWTGMMALQCAGESPECRRRDWTRLLGAQPSRGGTTGLLWRLRLKMLGHPPNVTRWHPRWPDFHATYVMLKAYSNDAGRLLAVSASPRGFARWLAPLCASVESIDPELDPISPRAGSRPRAQAFDVCLWVIERARLAPEQATIEGIRSTLKRGGCLVILITVGRDEEPVGLGAACAELGLRLERSGIRVEDTRYVPIGALRAALQRALAALIRAARGSPRAIVPLLLLAGALIVRAVAACNLMISMRRADRLPRLDCSSVIIAGRCVANASPQSIDCRNAQSYDSPGVPHRRERSQRNERTRPDQSRMRWMTS